MRCVRPCAPSTTPVSARSASSCRLATSSPSSQPAAPPTAAVGTNRSGRTPAWRRSGSTTSRNASSVVTTTLRRGKGRPAGRVALDQALDRQRPHPQQPEHAHLAVERRGATSSRPGPASARRPGGGRAAPCTRSAAAATRQLSPPSGRRARRRRERRSRADRGAPRRAQGQRCRGAAAGAGADRLLRPAADRELGQQAGVGAGDLERRAAPAAREPEQDGSGRHDLRRPPAELGAEPSEADGERLGAGGGRGGRRRAPRAAPCRPRRGGRAPRGAPGRRDRGVREGQRVGRRPAGEDRPWNSNCIPASGSEPVTCANATRPGRPEAGFCPRSG